MNSTSFTSIDTDCASNGDKMANIDSSSTAHLTLNASTTRPIRSTRSSNNSDSDPDRSPSVTVLTSIGNNSNHHHHHTLTRPSQLITGGFSLSNRLHLTKHQRTLWSRASSFEKLLMWAVFLLVTTTVLLTISLVSVFMSQKYQLELLHNQTQSNIAVVVNRDGSTALATVSNGSDRSKNYCLTPDCVKVAASVIEAIDLTVNPCDDFYVSTLISCFSSCYQSSFRFLCLLEI